MTGTGPTAKPPPTVVCDVGRVGAPDLTTVDALARLALEVRRAGCRVRLENVPDDLRGLLALTGLADVLPCADESVEPRRQPEQREELRGIEEERYPADPVA